VPWTSAIENEAQTLFLKTIREQKSKAANIFHLLGWEAAMATVRLLSEGPQSLSNWSYQSPRGKVTFHPNTQTTYAPLYSGTIVPDANGKCRMQMDKKIEITREEHERNWSEKQEGMYSGWKNNFFCT
jgi:branched-chain amino acid transport system substrate-binding protein